MEENVETEDSGQSKTELSVDIAEEEEKTQVNVEVLDDAETVAPEQPVYQIRPQLHEKFKPLSAKEVIHNVLFDQLSAKTYDAQEAIQWTKDIADIIRDKVKELKFKRYKYLVNVVLGEQHGAGVKMGTRCIWDAEADTYAYDSFVNNVMDGEKDRHMIRLIEGADTLLKNTVNGGEIELIAREYNVPTKLS